VIVDAAAELPPIENLKKYLKMGADIVLFSGGKDIRGPQSSGLMLGKKNIVNVCRLHGYPHHAIGRPMKLDKETIMGFVTALELYLNENHEKRMRHWENQIKRIIQGLNSIPHIQAFQGYPTQPLTQPAIIPRVYVKIDEKALGATKEDIASRLYEGDPPVAVIVEKKCLTFNPHMLVKGEEDIIIERMKDIIKKLVSQ